MNGGKDKKDFVLIQQVERRWSNSHNNQTSYKIDDPDARRASYQHNRANSLCVFYNSNILNYTKSIVGNENKKLFNANNKNTQQITPKDIKVLQNHEKVMEIQNKWTGNGKLIIRDKTNIFVSLKNFVYFI